MLSKLINLFHYNNINKILGCDTYELQQEWERENETTN
jgi:hypothetical protein